MQCITVDEGGSITTIAVADGTSANLLADVVTVTTSITAGVITLSIAPITVAVDGITLGLVADFGTSESLCADAAGFTTRAAVRPNCIDHTTAAVDGFTPTTVGVGGTMANPCAVAVGTGSAAAAMPSSMPSITVDVAGTITITADVLGIIANLCAAVDGFGISITAAVWGLPTTVRTIDVAVGSTLGTAADGGTTAAICVAVVGIGQADVG